MSKKLLATAYHEAGHAIMTIERYMRFRYVTIEPDEECAGKVVRYKNSLYKIIEGSSLMDPFKQAGLIEAEALITYAGEIAQQKGVPGSLRRYQLSSDHGKLLDSVGASPDDGVGLLYNKYLHAKAKQILDQPWVWSRVEAVANALIVNKTLSEKEVKQISWDALEVDTSNICKSFKLN